MKDKVRDQVISLEHISTERMLVDPLSKGLPPNMFREHVASMGLKKSLKFLDKRRPKVKYRQLIVTIKHALCANL